MCELLTTLLATPQKARLLLPCNNCLGQDEHILALQEALREVVGQNEVLRERVIELEALLSSLEDDITNEDDTLSSLQAEYHVKCQEKHLK